MVENGRFKYFPNLILIYCGVLLSLSFKSISDSLILTLDKSSCLQDFIKNIPTINYLFIFLLIYFIDDILDMLSFLSINPYVDSLRFYMDILINTSFYFCILLIANKSAFFLIGLVSVFFFTILWCIVCLYQKADNSEYLKFNIVIHFYGSLAMLYLYFFAGYCHSIITDQIALQYLIIFLIWVLIYEKRLCP